MKEIKMSLKNKDGKTIIKNIPENLASLYKMQGWEIAPTTVKKISVNSSTRESENSGK
jgi:hypothetical protein